MNLSTALAQANDPPGATREARKAIALAPQSADAYQALARALELSNDLDGATKAIHHSVELAPARADLHDGFGSLFVRQNDLLAAVAQFQEAIRLSPDFALATPALPPNSIAPPNSLRRIILPPTIWDWRAAILVMRKAPSPLCRRR